MIMNEDRLSRAQRAERAAVRAAGSTSQRSRLFYNARNGISVTLSREEERAALARVKQ